MILSTRIEVTSAFPAGFRDMNVVPVNVVPVNEKGLIDQRAHLRKYYGEILYTLEVSVCGEKG